MNYHSQVLFIFWFFIVHTAIFVYVMVAHIFKRSLFVVHSKSLSLFRVFEREKVNYGNLFRQNIKRAPFKPCNIHTHFISSHRVTLKVYIIYFPEWDLFGWSIVNGWSNRTRRNCFESWVCVDYSLLFPSHVRHFSSSFSLHSFAPITRSLCKLK